MTAVETNGLKTGNHHLNVRDMESVAAAMAVFTRDTRGEYLSTGTGCRGHRVRPRVRSFLPTSGLTLGCGTGRSCGECCNALSRRAYWVGVESRL